MWKRAKKYTMIVFEEDERYGSNGIQIDFYSNSPWEGNLSDIVEGNNIEELRQSSDGESNEGLFYLLYENETGKRIGSGTVDFDSIEEEINEVENRRYAVTKENYHNGTFIEWFYSYSEATRFAKEKSKELALPLVIHEWVNGNFINHTKINL